MFQYIDYVATETYTYRYDALGRLEKVESEDHETVDKNYISFGYNEYSEFETYTYNVFGLTRTVSYLYHEDGKYNKTTYDGVEKDYHYIANDVFNRLDNITLTTTDNNTITQSFTYDDSKVTNGNTSTRIETISYDLTTDNT